MDQIRGDSLTLHPLASLHRRADLVFFEGPLLSLFENSEGEPYLFLWADVDDYVNRWLVFRVSSERLANYLAKGVTLRELVQTPSDGFVFVADINEPGEFTSVQLVTASEIPTDYLPSKDSLYEFTPKHAQVDLPDLVRRYKSPLLDVHLLRGEGVHFGSADAVTLGSVLRSTGELSESVALSLFAGRDTDGSHDREAARAYGKFDFITHKAASFSAILRPVVTQETLAGFRDRTSEVIEIVLDLLGNTPEYEGLQRAASMFHDQVIRHLESFAKEVATRRIEIELRWAPIGAEVPQAVKVNALTSSRIIENINRLELEESEGFWNQGVFLAVDTKRRSYRFQSASGRESTGTFDKKMSYPVTHISFEREYGVYMNRKTLKASGRARPRIVEVIGEVHPTDELPLLNESAV